MGKQLDSFSPETANRKLWVSLWCSANGDISGALVHDGDYQTLYYCLLVIVIFLSLL